MKLETAVSDLHDAEIDLAQALDAAAERHSLDAAFAPHAATLAGHARERAAALAEQAARIGSDEPRERRPSLVADALGALRRAVGAALGHDQHAGAILLHDLLHLHRLAGEGEVGWWLVRQGALVRRDEALYLLFESCHEGSWNTLRWLKTKIKQTAPQVLAGPLPA